MAINSVCESAVRVAGCRSERTHRVESAGPAAILDESATDAYAHLFRALADSSRLGILQHLATGPHRVRDLVEHLGLAQSTVSNHLRFLAECKLVEVHPDGRSSWYALAEPRLLSGLIDAAERLLAQTGTLLTLCAHLHSWVDEPSAVHAESIAHRPNEK